MDTPIYAAALDAALEAAGDDDRLVTDLDRMDRETAPGVTGAMHSLGRALTELGGAV